MTENLTKKILPFFHCESFFLKTIFLFAFKWFLLIFFALAVSNFFLFICVFNESNYDNFSVFRKKKSYEQQKSLILQAKLNRFLQISVFYRNPVYVYFKKASCTVCGETWIQFCCYVCHICLHNLFRFANLHNLTRDTFLISWEKKADKVCVCS